MSDGEKLLALQDRDLAIARTEKALDELPEKLAVLQLRKRLKDIRAVYEQAAAYLRKANALVAKSADEAASLQSKIDSEQAKVLSGNVTNPKELQNLTRELASLQRRKDAVEFEELKLMEKAEAGEAQLAKVQAAIDEGAAKEASLIEAYKTKGGELTREIAKMKQERELLAAAIPGELLSQYESLRVSKHGIGAAALTGDLCSGCRTQVPSSKAQALRSGPELARCPNCFRILVVSERRP